MLSSALVILIVVIVAPNTEIPITTTLAFASNSGVFLIWNLTKDLCFARSLATATMLCILLLDWYLQGCNIKNTVLFLGILLTLLAAI